MALAWWYKNQLKLSDKYYIVKRNIKKEDGVI